MLLYDSQLEYRALRTVCESTNRAAAGKLLARLKPSHFNDDSAREIFEEGILYHVKAHNKVPRWSDIVASLRISEDVREEATAYKKKIKPVKDPDDIKNTFFQLEDYRKARVLFDTSNKALEALSKDKVDVTKLYEKTTSKLVRTQVGTLSDKEQVIIGKGANKKHNDAVIDKLFNRNRDNLIPTGFSTFDERNGGWGKGSLIVIAATTGGGKSAAMVAISKNQAELGYKVRVVPLEMTEEEIMARYMANISGIDVRKFAFVPITDREEKKARKKWKRWTDNVIEGKGRLSIYEPDEDMGIEEILTIAEPYDDDIIYVDYIGLLKGVDGDDAWQALGAAARYAKIWAKRKNKVVVLLAQLSDEGAIRYSKAIKDHANNFWAWVYTEENRQTGLIDVMQQKARNQQAFDFSLMHDFSTMRMWDADDESVKKMRTKKGNDKKRRLSKAMRDSEDDVSKYLSGDAGD